jgi:hypothetical protein
LGILIMPASFSSYMPPFALWFMSIRIWTQIAVMIHQELDGGVNAHDPLPPSLSMVVVD